MKYSSEIEKLPIGSHLDEICEKLQKSKSHFLILTAETGAGKSTCLPVALLNHFKEKILVLEPRRLAVLNVAERINDLSGEKNLCGYQMHLESKIYEETRCIVLTEAVLIKKIQSDPELKGISVVVIDEFHERSVNADLSLALLKEIVSLRDDLFVVIMSATMETDKLSAYLDCTETVKIPGRLFPVEVNYLPNQSVTEAILQETEKFSVKYKNCGGSLLVFLPGISEIRRIESELKTAQISNEILILHSSISLDEQRKVLKPVASSCCRIILSSAIAETSLTVPDVFCVIDSGEARINVYNQSLGMESLITRRVSQFNAEQRKGRAGRVSEGKCIRLWDKNEVLVKETQPEILRSDLSSIVLECKEWGINSLEEIRWLENPPKAAWNQAEALLEEIKCLENGKITLLGKNVLHSGISPRLACIVLQTDEKNMEQALELVLKYSNYSESSLAVQKLFLSDLKKRIYIMNKVQTNSPLKQTNSLKSQTNSAAELLLFGFPDRIARRTEIVYEKNHAFYQFPSGRKAYLLNEKNDFPEYIIAPKVNLIESTGKILAYEEVEKSFAEKWLNERAEKTLIVEFENNQIDGKLIKKEEFAYKKLVISSKKIPATEKDYNQAIVNYIKSNGILKLPLTENTCNFLKRVKFYLENEIECEEKSNLLEKYENLQTNPEEWLLPFVTGTEKITKEKISNALFWYLEGSFVNNKVPVEIVLENGKKRRLTYAEQNGKIIVTLEVLIQHIFGCTKTPSVLQKPVLLKLLSPARRPLQITDNLENFWQTAWPEICKEMKGRYPKHNWNYKVTDDEI